MFVAGSELSPRGQKAPRAKRYEGSASTLGGLNQAQHLVDIGDLHARLPPLRSPLILDLFQNLPIGKGNEGHASFLQKGNDVTGARLPVSVLAQVVGRGCFDSTWSALALRQRNGSACHIFQHRFHGLDRVRFVRADHAGRTSLGPADSVFTGHRRATMFGGHSPLFVGNDTPTIKEWNSWNRNASVANRAENQPDIIFCERADAAASNIARFGSLQRVFLGRKGADCPSCAS